MLNKKFCVNISLFVLTILSLELLSQVSQFWNIIYSILAKGAVCVFVTGFLIDVVGGKILKGRINPKGKAVLITGCGSGFGYHLARRLDSRGYKVFAACHNPDRGGALELKNVCSQRLQVLPMEITEDESVQNAKRFIMDNMEDCELWAVVNNAGIFKGFQIEFCTMDDFQSALEVNALGCARVTKAFLPLLRQSKGRVVNVNSQSGRFNLPHFAPYCMSKHAALSFTECLRQEMLKWNISVISVEPEFFKTNIGNETYAKLSENMSKNLNDDLKRIYGQKYLASTVKLLQFISDSSSPNVDIVIDDLESAISAEYPNSVYSPFRNIFFKLFAYFGQNLPDDVFYTLIRKIA